MYIYIHIWLHVFTYAYTCTHVCLIAALLQVSTVVASGGVIAISLGELGYGSVTSCNWRSRRCQFLVHRKCGILAWSCSDMSCLGLLCHSAWAYDDSFWPGDSFGMNCIALLKIFIMIFIVIFPIIIYIYIYSMILKIMQYNIIFLDISHNAI